MIYSESCEITDKSIELFKSKLLDFLFSILFVLLTFLLLKYKKRMRKRDKTWDKNLYTASSRCDSVSVGSWFDILDDYF